MTLAEVLVASSNCSHIKPIEGIEHITHRAESIAGDNFGSLKI